MSILDIIRTDDPHWSITVDDARDRITLATRIRQSLTQHAVKRGNTRVLIVHHTRATSERKRVVEAVTWALQTSIGLCVVDYQRVDNVGNDRVVLQGWR